MPIRGEDDQQSKRNPAEAVGSMLGDKQQPVLPTAPQSIEDTDDDEPLMDLEIQGSGRALSEAAIQLLTEGRARFKSVNVFDFVPSNYEMVWDVLDALPRGTFCEYGSGFGIATGIAELLGFNVLGIELAPELVAASRDLLSSQGLKARIELGDYLERRDMADIYFTYAWPSHMRSIERHFLEIAKPDAKLLYCYGQDDIRCKVFRKDAVHSKVIRSTT